MTEAVIALDVASMKGNTVLILLVLEQNSPKHPRGDLIVCQEKHNSTILKSSQFSQAHKIHLYL